MYNILVVDDDRLIGEMLKFMLTHEGYQVMVSTNPEQTVKNILSNNIDLVLLDQFISGTSGIAICKALRNNKKIGVIPIIMISAESDVRVKCLEAGATDFIDKPFDRKEFLSKVKIILNQVH